MWREGYLVTAPAETSQGRRQEAWLAPLLVVLAALALTALGWMREEANERRHAQLRLERAAEGYIFEVSERLSLVEGLLHAGQGFYASHEKSMTSEAYRQFVQSLNMDKQFPGVEGMGFILPVPQGGLMAWDALLRKRDPAFRIRPPHPGPEHYITVLTEPMEATKGALGFDSASSPERKAALERARDAGAAMLTPKLSLVTNNGVRTGLLYYHPVYRLGVPLSTVEERRQALAAWVVSGFFIDKLLGSMKTDADELDVDIYDGEALDTSKLLYDSSPPNLEREAEFRLIKTLQVGGRVWTLRFSSLPRFERAARTHRGLLVLSGGMIISLLLGLATYLLASGRDKAQREARRMTVALRDERNFIAAILDAQAAATLVLDGDGVIRKANHAAEMMTGLPAVSLMGLRLIDLIADPAGKVAIEGAFDRMGFGGAEDGCETSLSSQSGQPWHLRWNFVRLAAAEPGGLIIATGVDLTEKKRIEDALRLERNLFVGGPVVVFRWLARPGWPVAYVSSNVSQFGIQSGDLLSGRTTYPSLIHLEDRERLAQEVRRHVESGADSFEQEYRLIRPDGVELWVYDFTVIERRLSGEVEAFLGYVIDVTARKKAEESRRQSETRFGSIIEHTSEGYWEVDADRQTLAVNAALCRLLGYEAQEIIGRDPRSFAAQGHEAIFDDQMAKRVQRQRSYDIWLRRKSGQLVYCRLNATTMFDSHGQVSGSFALVSDITAEHQATAQLRKEEGRLRSIIETVPVAILLTRPSGQVLHFNASAMEIFRLKSEEKPLGNAADYYVQPAEREKFLSAIRSQGRVDQFETQLKRFDGTSFWCFLSARMFTYEDEPALLVGCVDISERKVSELRLAEMTEELQRSNAELEQFAYVASHDLQEPLRMVASYVQLLERRYRDKLDDEAVDFINFAVDGAKRMQAMINDLLDYSRVTRKGRPFASVDTRRAVDEALANLSGLVQETGALIDIGGLPNLEGDDRQIVRLFQNLIGNALKYRSPERRAEISISAIVKDGQMIFSVKDNGIGISPEFHDRIFVLFQRLHTRKEYPGTGIGLSLCRKIVERHGGQIWLETTPGQSTCFYFSFPVT
jgi:PAS domain S-box-containing protein